MNGTRSMLKIFAFIQARTTSTRLPNKVLRKLPSNSNQLLLDHIIERLSIILSKENIVLLIPIQDKPLIEYCKSRDLNFFEGSENDVRDRFIQAGQHYQADIIIRLTADNPFIDVHYIELLIETFIHSKLDIASFSDLPIGMGVEIFTFDAVCSEPLGGLLDRHREHVSLHLKEDSNRYKFVKLTPFLTEEEIEIVHKIRLTIDEEKDFELSDTLHNILSQNSPLFGVQEVIELYREEPELFKINAQVQQLTFTVSNRNSTKQSIFILYATPEYSGSGHYERSKLLKLKLEANGFHVAMDKKLNSMYMYDLYIIDHRDLTVPFQIREKKVILLDNFGEDRENYPHYDTLYHPNLSFKDVTQKIFLPKMLNLYKKSNSYNNLLVYAGSLPEELTDKLDSFLYGQFGSQYRIVRIGGHPIPKEEIYVHTRLHRTQFYRELEESDIFCSYYGQSIMESMHLKKKILLYSISEYHDYITKPFAKIASIPYIGNVSVDDLSLGSHSVLESKIDLDNDGYDKFIDYVQKLFL